MKLHINFRKTKLSEEIKHYTKEKIKRELDKFHNLVEQADIVINHTGREYSASCHMKGSNSFSFVAEAIGIETHEAVDNMIKKVDAILKKKKEKLKNHREPHPKGKKNEYYEETSFIDFYQDDSDLFSIDSEDLLKLENLKKKIGDKD